MIDSTLEMDEKLIKIKEEIRKSKTIIKDQPLQNGFWPCALTCGNCPGICPPGCTYGCKSSKK